MTQPRPILLCTVGTSLFFPNLKGLADQLAAGKLADDKRPLAEAYRDKRWPDVARLLAALPPTERTCGAEINSIASTIDSGLAAADCGLFFFHSATDDGRAIARILVDFFHARGHRPVEKTEIEDLQDEDPRRFRTRGLRNLARELCRVVRERGPAACAINATGGYKAQIAIAVLMGQALAIPVCYMHERFSEIITFPPLPVALDFEVWMRASGLLAALVSSSNLVPRRDFDDEWDERYDSLVAATTIEGIEYLELSATGLIFHETFRTRFRSHKDQVLPPPAPPGRKRPPVLKADEGHLLAHREAIERFLRRVTDEVPQVVQCRTHYFNPDLPQPIRFRETRGQVEGVYSDGTATIKFWVETTAQTDGQRAAVVAALNDWLHASA
jgi:putative CRISPR-associated protein (TIGR02619 family)